MRTFTKFPFIVLIAIFFILGIHFSISPKKDVACAQGGCIDQFDPFIIDSNPGTPRIDGYVADAGGNCPNFGVSVPLGSATDRYCFLSGAIFSDSDSPRPYRIPFCMYLQEAGWCGYNNLRFKAEKVGCILRKTSDNQWELRAFASKEEGHSGDCDARATCGAYCLCISGDCT
ncbi:MAG: hypothetical protein KC713_05810 [Candidatus Omnitrophica bacterium]|nr:hypothetical protein [Candidatus Omnitrophota bacterium]